MGQYLIETLRGEGVVMGCRAQALYEGVATDWHHIGMKILSLLISTFFKKNRKIKIVIWNMPTFWGTVQSKPNLVLTYKPLLCKKCCLLKKIYQEENSGCWGGGHCSLSVTPFFLFLLNCNIIPRSYIDFSSGVTKTGVDIKTSHREMYERKPLWLHLGVV